jgi:hypothetical protein
MIKMARSQAALSQKSKHISPHISEDYVKGGMEDDTCRHE